MSPDKSHQQEAVLSVSSLNKMARGLLESNFPAVVVEGEISNLATPASGHWYLTLKDKKSQVRCAMFSGRNRFVRFKPQNGNQVIIRGKLSIYENRGDYQLIADSMEEAGDGALRRAFEELKAKLQAEGLFDEEHKQDIYSYYNHVGVITSATGAAIQDILSVFNRRFPATRITLLPVTVQGADAPEEIARAIELANKHRAKLGLEALIVGRGGGSLEDLQAFNEERVARAIFASELPITSAVGHEIDFTIADFVADLRAPTPSAAAEQMSPDQDEYQETCAAYKAAIRSKLSSILKQARQDLMWLAKQLKRPDRRLQEHAQNLDRLENQMQVAIKNQIALQKGELRRLRQGMVANSPLNRIRLQLVQLGKTSKDIMQAVGNALNQTHGQLAELSRSLSAISPLSTLARGYSITYDENGQVIRSSKELKIGSMITSRLAKGSITSTIETIKEEEK
ncbi:MAG: exodeoxyribonuclease VII large subunit [Gammaproteobacteria bacterium]|nr:exodeoxyribonuclease VII large subunit [Gammaproteobacteria bacterium]MDD9958676.1 exodeoxyribonuclease VII large subunit [Gammaproteobacteria bacterium]